MVKIRTDRKKNRENHLIHKHVTTHQERGEKDQDVEDAHSFRHIRSMSDTICERLASCEHATVTFASELS